VRIRKFRKSDIREIVKIKNESFGKFNSCEYFDKKGVEIYMERTNLNKSDEELLKALGVREGVIFYVAEEDGKIVGYIKGEKNKIGNLFVLGKSHKRGIGAKLVKKLEEEAIKQGSSRIRIKASLYATLFYEKMGYKKTTGIRNFLGLKVQPMAKKLK